MAITAFDEYLIHQTAEPIDHVVTSDRRFYDRYYFNFFNHSGSIYVLTGMAVYPNNDVMDGFAMVTTGNGDEQRNLRASRMLDDRDRHRTSVGPLRIEVIEPLRKLRLSCAPNEQGFSYDLTLETSTRPFTRVPHSARSNGRITIENSHYSQCYRCSGVITIDGDRHEITPESWWGIRDHSWGVRGGVYPLDEAPPNGMAPNQNAYEGNWIPMMFDDCYLMVYFRPGTESAELIYPWDDTRPSRKILDIERKDVEMDESRRRFLSARLVLTDETEDTFEIVLRHRSSSFLRGGGYGPIGDFLHGKPMGSLIVQGECWDLRTPNFHPQRGIAEHMVEARWGTKTGYGIFNVVDEAMFTRPYARYTAARSSAGPP